MFDGKDKINVNKIWIDDDDVELGSKPTTTKQKTSQAIGCHLHFGFLLARRASKSKEGRQSYAGRVRELWQKYLVALRPEEYPIIFAGMSNHSWIADKSSPHSYQAAISTCLLQLFPLRFLTDKG